MTPENPDVHSLAHTPGQHDEEIPGAKLEADLQAHIGRTLRAVYDEVVNEPVPDKFRRLLEELERKQANGT